MLTAQFLLGLKPELRAPVEMQLPDSVAKAAILATMLEQLLNRVKRTRKPCIQSKSVGMTRGTTRVHSPPLICGRKDN
jgi:hypothetical protein